MSARAKKAPRMVVFVDETMFVEGHGFRASIVVEGESGHHPTGSWPYDPGNRDHKMPWFWGPTIADARAAAESLNKQAGIDKDTAFTIVAQSMAGAPRRTRADE